ncbi:MAG TPA: hypothetical protein VIT65_08570 [Microlunatus sp.]
MIEEEGQPEVLEDPSVLDLDRVVEHLAERFPDVDPHRVREIVEGTYHALNSQAKVTDHLTALTQHDALNRLKQESPAGPGPIPIDQTLSLEPDPDTRQP